MSLIGYNLNQYPLDKQYENCRQYIGAMNWDKILDDVRAKGTVAIDVSDCIASFLHLGLDSEYLLICYVTKGYHGNFGRVKAVKKSDDWDPPCNVDSKDDTKGLRLPEHVFPPMEAIYNDGTSEGYFEAVLFSQFIQAIPYTGCLYNQWPHILNTAPEKYEEWECQIELTDWSPRHFERTITALCYEFEYGLGASDGRDRIYLTQFNFFSSVNDYLLMSAVKHRSADSNHITIGKRYDESKKCCLFTQSSVLVAREKQDVI